MMSSNPIHVCFVVCFGVSNSDKQRMTRNLVVSQCPSDGQGLPGGVDDLSRYLSEAPAVHCLKNLSFRMILNQASDIPTKLSLTAIPHRKPTVFRSFRGHVALISSDSDYFPSKQAAVHTRTTTIRSSSGWTPCFGWRWHAPKGDQSKFWNHVQDFLERVVMIRTKRC